MNSVDTFERAYAAVVYLKIVYQQGGAGNIQFVASRTRVCPQKKQHSQVGAPGSNYFGQIDKQCKEVAAYTSTRARDLLLG